MSVRRYTRKVADRLPEPALAAARGSVQTWGELTARWRMEPSFLVVGAQRSGTTTLFRLLSEHPYVLRPTQSKGIAYFDLNYHRGPRWYRGHFPLRLSARLAARGGAAQTFESSGYYLFHPLAADRIARDLPDVKVVVVVREPVERAYSAHRHELARGFETEPFERAVALEEERIRGEAERMMSDPTYESFAHRHQAYLSRSRYAEQIERFVGLMGADRVFVMDADRFFESPVEEFARLQEWLGLPRWDPSRVEQWNARKRDPLTAELRAELTRYFEPHDAKLEVLMGRTPRWRESG